jgi:hypothetical protein
MGIPLSAPPRGAALKIVDIFGNDTMTILDVGGGKKA